MSLLGTELQGDSRQSQESFESVEEHARGVSADLVAELPQPVEFEEAEEGEIVGQIPAAQETVEEGDTISAEPEQCSGAYSRYVVNNGLC